MKLFESIICSSYAGCYNGQVWYRSVTSVEPLKHIIETSTSLHVDGDSMNCSELLYEIAEVAVL